MSAASRIKAMRGGATMRALLALVWTLIAVVIIYGLYMISGGYDVAATTPHTRPVAWLFDSIRKRSVSRHATDMDPPDLSDPKLILAGLNDFEAMCAQCHTRPGGTPSAVAAGLNPPPPNLAESATWMTAAELFWVTKNGIKMTGMPAWGESHEDTQLWPVVAFLVALPSLDTDDYAELREQARGAGGHHDDETTSAQNAVSDAVTEPAEDTEAEHDHTDHEH